MRRAFQAENPFTYPEEPPHLPMVLATKGAVYSLQPGYSRNAFDGRYVGWGARAWKMGASASVLIATIVFESFIPGSGSSVEGLGFRI